MNDDAFANYYPGQIRRSSDPLPTVFVGNPLIEIAETLNRIEKNLRDIQNALERLAQP